MQTSNRLEDLNPIFRPIAKMIIDEANEEIEDGLIRPAQTFRSMTDQAAAEAAGLSKVKMGWHQFGLAMDVAVISDAGVYVTDGSDSRYTLYGSVAKRHGCIWGGDWQTFKDPPHCEYHPNFSLSQYLAWLDSHRVVTA